MNSRAGSEAGGVEEAIIVRRSARARLLRLRIDPRKRAVILTVPGRMPERKALEWARGHSDWIEKTLAGIPPAAAIAHGSIVPLYGVPHRLEWSEDRPRTARVEEDRIVIGGPAETIEARLLRWLAQHARGVLERETREFAAKAGVGVVRIGIGDPTSRWGSCSESGTIRYSWRLILAPDWVRRATVAHEVAHRVHMNHGPDFHALVAELLEDDPAPARLWLRRNGAALHRFGRSG